MTRNSRKILLATTMLAGLTISTLDAAQAGPNGGPSLGSISGFSSTRMDFNRVGGPGRALSRNELRVVPLDVGKTTEKPKDTMNVGKNIGKNISKKDTNVARVSNPKFSTGGDNKPGVQSGTNLPINPNVTAERIDAAALAARLKIGPLAVDVPWGAGDGSFAWPEFWPGKTEQARHDRTTLDDLQNGRVRGEPGSGGASGGPDTSKTGWAGIWVHQSTHQGNGWSVSTYRNDETGATGTRRSSWNGDTSRREVVVEGRDSSGNNTRDRTVNETHTDSRGHVIRSRVSESSDIIDNGDGTTTTVTFRTYTVTDNGETVYRYESNTSTTTDSEGNVVDEKKDSQPTEGYSARGMGRPASICGPGGCWVGDATSRRYVNPREENGSTAPTTRRASPGWATDPNPDEFGRNGGNGGGTGYTPQDEEGGDIGGPGNPALEGLNAAL